MSHIPGELIIRDVSEFENVKAYSIEKLENGDRSIVCKLHESSICPEHFPGQTVLDLAHLFKAAPAMKEALEGLLEHMWETEVNGIGIESPSDALEEAIKKAHKALTLANSEKVEDITHLINQVRHLHD